MGLKNATIPQTTNIPKAGSSQTPRAELGQKNNIKDGVLNEYFE